jgi:hypothetical protein
MKFMTKALEKRFAQVGKQSYSDDPIVIAKFFVYPGPHTATYLAIEYDPKDQIFHGYRITSDDSFIRYSFPLRELESLRNDYDLDFRRDLTFQEKPYSKVCENYR